MSLVSQSVTFLDNRSGFPLIPSHSTFSFPFCIPLLSLLSLGVVGESDSLCKNTPCWA